MRRIQKSMLHYKWEKEAIGMEVFGYLRREPTLDSAHNAAWLEAQRLAIRRFCRKKRLELLRFYESTGKEELEDSSLEEMLTALEEKEADCAIVCGEYEGGLSYNIDHLERSVEIRFFSRRLPHPIFVA